VQQFGKRRSTIEHAGTRHHQEIVIMREFTLRFCCFIGLLVVLAGPGGAVDGVVLTPEGEPIAGIQVRAFSSRAVIQPDQALEQHRTGTDGTFTIRGEYDHPVILEVTGERGTGRVRWTPADAGNDADRIAITYPVKETVILLHDNDHHFDFNSADEFQKRVENYRREHEDVFLLNAGDIFVRHPHRWEADGESFEGNTEWYRERALAIVKTMNRMGYDAMTLGNHELAHIETHTREALELAEFPLLATNVELTTDKLPPVERLVVLKTGTQRTIAVLGLTVGSGDGVQILNRTRVAQQHASLADEHDLVVALNHIGYKGTRNWRRSSTTSTSSSAGTATRCWKKRRWSTASWSRRPGETGIRSRRNIRRTWASSR
jgi:hypothetical protein